MSKKTRMRLLTPSANRRWNEFLGLLWIAIALFGVFSLATFSPADTSINTASASAETRNWAGAIGALTADLLYQLFGACAFLLPAGLSWLGWLRFRSIAPSNPWAKATGAVLLVFSLMTAVALIPYPILMYELFPLGGLLGAVLAEVLSRSLNGPGSIILLGITLIALSLPAHNFLGGTSHGVAARAIRLDWTAEIEKAVWGTRSRGAARISLRRRRSLKPSRSRLRRRLRRFSIRPNPTSPVPRTIRFRFPFRYRNRQEHAPRA